MIETVFLGVLILALVIGNLLLFIVPKKQLQQKTHQERVNAQVQPAESTGFEVNSAVKALVLEERLGILNRRLERLEGFISNSGSASVSEKSGIVIAKRLVELEESKRRMHIEIEALKQRLSKVREELRLPADDSKKKIGLGISEEKLHELAFNTAK